MEDLLEAGKYDPNEAWRIALQKLDSLGTPTTVDGNLIPTIVTRYIKTTVSAPNCSTIVLGGLITVSDLRSQTLLAQAFAISLVVLGLALIIDLGFRRGTVGPNRYGPDPLDTST